MNTMSLLRNSVIVGGATFLVGSAFMEIGKADSKSDIGKWPYVATFLSGALGFYLLKQNFIPVPKALELNADSDNIIRFKVGERYTHRYHHGYGFYDNEVMRRTDKTVWTSQVNPETGEVDYPLLVSQHRIYTKQPFELDGKIVSGWESYGLGNHAYGVAAGDTSLRTYDVKNADYTDSDLSHFGKPLEEDEEFTTMQVRIGSPSGSTTSWTTAFNLQCVGDDDNLTYFTGLLEDSVRDRVREWNGDELDDFTQMQIVIGSPSGSTTSWYRAFTVQPVGDEENLYYLSGEIQDLLVDKAKWWNSHEVIYDAESSSSLQSFAAEVFMADRKIRRRTRWTWTRGNEPGFSLAVSELPYDIDYQGQQGRGYLSKYVPLYSVEDSYHISDLPEGYHLHLYKPSVRSGSWRAFSKSPKSEDWNEYTNYKKSNLTGDLLNWYNQDIARPEEQTLSPIEKLMISKGLKSGTIQIERVVIPKTKYTPKKVQYFAFGGPNNMSPTNFCEIESGVISLENLRYSNEPNLFAFGQGLKFMTEKAGTLRSVNRFNKNPQAWVKSYPAWFQNAVKNNLTEINVTFSSYTEYDGGIKINDIKVLKFLNGVDRYSWRAINESERKMVDTPYGELPQFEIYELDMSDPAPITPRPSTMRKIYAKSFKQNLNGEWRFDEDMFMMAVVDKYKFENGGSERVHNSMVGEILYSIDIIPYMTPMAELMARRYKKKE